MTFPSVHSENITTRLALQARLLTRRFAISPALAEQIAALAFMTEAR